MKMKAYRLTAWQQPPELLEIPVPEPGPGQVLIKVAGSGACHSDLHLMDWPAGQLDYRLPFTLGHEVTGWVAALGAGVHAPEVGEPVAVYGPWGCGSCRNCLIGAENYCERPGFHGGAGGGLGLDGGMADYMLVPSARFLVPLGDLEPHDAAPLGDAALTSYHAIKRGLHLLVPGSHAVVIGAGGLGHMAVQIIRELTPSRVIVVDSDPGKLRHAIDLGAHRAIQAGEEAPAQVREASRGRGAEMVLDFVGAEATIALGAKCIRPLGQLTVVGLAGGGFPFSFFALPFEASLATTYWGTLGEFHEVLSLAKAGRIRPQVERFALADIAEAYALLREGKVDGRAVIVPAQKTSHIALPASYNLQVLAALGADAASPLD